MSVARGSAQTSGNACMHTYLHTYVCTYIYIYIYIYVMHSIDWQFKVTLGCGIAHQIHKNTKHAIHSIISILCAEFKCYAKFIICAWYFDYDLFFNIRNSSPECEQCVFKYFAKADINWAIHSSNLQVCMVNWWIFWGQHTMYCSENLKGCNLFYEDVIYFLC